MQRIQKTISEFMRGRPGPVVGPEATAMDAVTLMASQRFDCVLVVEEGSVIGIFTERDFLNRVAAEGRVAADAPIREIMTLDPEVLRPDACVSYAIERMANRGFRNIPIVQDGMPPSLLTVRDVMQHLSDILADVESKDIEEEIQEWTDLGGGG